jgi:hypothetical protein
MSELDDNTEKSQRTSSVAWDNPKDRPQIKWSEELIKATIDKTYRTDAIHRGLRQFKKDLAPVAKAAPTSLPRALSGLLLLPDGRSAARISVEAERPNWRHGEDPAPWHRYVAVTDTTGRFSLPLPDAPIPKAGLMLLLRGSDTYTTLMPKAADVARGDLGTVTIDRPLSALSDEAVEALRQDLEAVDGTLDDFPLGEGDCARRFSSNAGVIDRYRWSNLIRLVEPQVYPKQGKVSTDGGDVKTPASGTLEALIYRTGAQRAGDRIPIGEPIDIDDFKRRLEDTPEDVPKAGSLALGYIVQMSQTWIPRGLSLGNLLYSLPLAPGEQQKIVISESEERLTIQEAESAQLEEVQSQTDTISRTTSQMFGSTLEDMARGGSSFLTEGKSGNLGGGFSFLGIGFSSGGSWSSTSGSTSSWQKSSRDFVSWAAESFHSRLSRRAAISRRVTSASVRLASLDDRDEFASKTVANYNRTRALTLQYWEVMKNYTVTTDVDDIQMVCFVPLEIVRWLTKQPGDPPDGTLPSSVDRDYLLKRYEVVLRHADTLRRRFRFRPRFRRALEVLEQLAANPLMELDADKEERQLVMHVSVTGTFLPFDNVTVEIVTRNGRRVGPVAMTLASVEGPVAREALTRGDIVDELRARRSDVDGAESTRATDIVLPRSVAASDIARFEFRHNYHGWTYRPPDIRAESAESGDTLEIPLFGQNRPIARTPISFSARELGQLVGAPRFWDVEVHSLTEEETAFASDLTGTNAAILMPARYALPVSGLEPIVDQNELRLVEELLAHLREHALRFSRAVWSSLTPQERAILLEPWTLGLPIGNDQLSEIPLLSCVANRVLGYYGNAMVLPFHVPRQLAEETGTTSLELEETLLRFHRQAFRPPRTEIALTTGGMLGEAVLGACVSAEEIDLTRLWSWSDAPLPEVADDPTEVTFKPERLVPDTATAAGPSVLKDVAEPTYNIQPSSLPMTDLVLANFLAKLPESQLPEDLAASNLAKSLAPLGLSEAAGLAKTAAEKGMAMAKATQISWDDVLKAVKDAGKLGREVANLSMSTIGPEGLSSMLGDPSQIVNLLAATPEGQREAKAGELALSLTGGKALSATDQAGAHAALSEFGTSIAGDVAKTVALKVLMGALGLPPVL